MPIEVAEKTEGVPTKERIEFQSFLVKEIYGDSVSDDQMLAWISKYAKKVSEIIDSDNGKLRELIMGGNYKEASTIIAPMLEK